MDCACVLVDDNGVDLPAFYSDRVITAKKAHKCCECGRTIQPPERYEYVTGKWESSILVFKTCADCLSIRKSFFCDGYLHGGMFEYLCRHIIEMRGEISSDCLVDLTSDARARVCEMIEKAWEDFDDEEDTWTE